MEFKIANEKEKEDIEVELEQEDNNTTKSVKPDNEFKRKIMFFAIVILVVFLLLMLILSTASLFSDKSYSYDDIEKVLEESAIKYFKDNKKSLPNDSQVVEITDKTLTATGYMNDISEYIEDGSTCSGKVSVQKVDDEYTYTPYLDCGENYNTKPLLSTITKKTVTSGDGLYKYQNGYVFRGEIVNNYVKLDKALWRVVKITSDDDIVLILDDKYSEGYSWDDRYNNEKEYNAGINDYKASRVRNFLMDVYKDDTDYAILSKNDRAKIKTHDACIGLRSNDSTLKDNSLECSSVINGEKLSLLTLSDYMNASIDSTCVNAKSYSCQNYNYLVSDFDWWLATAASGTTDIVYMIRNNGVIKENYASGYANIRPVIYLNDNVYIKSGKGTKEAPYKLK